MWRETFSMCVAVVLCVCAMAAKAESVGRVYVDDDGVAGGDGSSWTNACKHLQDALAIAKTAAKPVEIRIGQGVYKPDQGDGIAPGDRTATFRLLSGVVLKGGYAGLGATDPDARDARQYETVLSGDLKGDDVAVEDVNQLSNEPTRGDNSVHVVTVREIDGTAELDGLVIAAGYGSSSDVVSGGGMLIDSAGPVVRDCVFRGNFASTGGGAVQNRDSSPVFSNCSFNRNCSGSSGGAMRSTNSRPLLAECTFEENAADDEGGAIECIANSKASLRDCVFIRSRAERGGALYSDAESAVDLDGCTFEDNRATSGSYMNGGGAIMSCLDLAIAECVFRRNSAARDGGAVLAYTCDLRVSGCLFTDNHVDAAGDAARGGGAIDSDVMTIATIEDSRFEGNAGPDGGAVRAEWASVKLVGCDFIDNTAWGCGGALLASGSWTTATGCSFQGNLAADKGGAAFYQDHAYPVFNNCVLAGNRAERGGGICSTEQRSVTLNNCTLASNIAADGTAFVGSGAFDHCIAWDREGSALAGYTDGAIFHSDVHGDYPRQDNIDADPLFVREGHWADANDPNLTVEAEVPGAVWIAGDYHLQSQAGHWDLDSQSWIGDPATSPCIDAGDIAVPIGDEPFPNGGILNLGAYGGTAQASKSYFGTPLCETPIDGDVNGDCRVDATDAELLSQDWRTSGAPTSNQPPSVTILSPADGATIKVNSANPTITITVNASDADGFVGRVRFYAAGETDCESCWLPTADDDGTDIWQWQWGVLKGIEVSSPGPYTITAWAIDDDGETAIASVIHVTISTEP